MQDKYLQIQFDFINIDLSNLLAEYKRIAEIFIKTKSQS